jgi:hypothetical protein
MHSVIPFAAVFAMGLSCPPGLAQQPGPSSPADNSGVTVRLEPHEEQTHFELGDRIILDLVFTAKSPGYAVFTGTNEFNAPEDLVNVTPTDGWFSLSGEPVRWISRGPWPRPGPHSGLVEPEYRLSAARPLRDNDHNQAPYSVEDTRAGAHAGVMLSSGRLERDHECRRSGHPAARRA